MKRYLAILLALPLLGALCAVGCDGSKPTTPKPKPTPTVTSTPSGGGIRKIVFWSNRTGNYEIYSMNPDGSSLTKLTNTPANEFFASFSFDASKIAFGSFRDGDLEIYSMDANGQNQTRLTNYPNYDQFPSWSPDGTKIIFERFKSTFQSNLYIMDYDGNNPTQITDPFPTPTPATYLNIRHTRPTWSPDGSKIGYASQTGDSAVCVIDPDGFNRTCIPNNFQWESSPSWSPDGSKIAFNSSRDGNDEIYVTDPDGTNQTRLTNNSASDYSPFWSPDGTKIGFVSNRTGDYEIYTMDTNGNNQVNITKNPADDYANNMAWR